MSTLSPTLSRPPTVEEPALVDHLLRDPVALDRRFAEAAGVSVELPRLVGLTVAAFAAYAAAQGLIVTRAGAEVFPAALWRMDAWRAGACLFLAYSGGMFGAQVAGLPSAWFYALLAGLRTPANRIVAEAMRAQATSAMVLLGLLPLYLAAGLGLSLATGEDVGSAFLRNAFFVPVGYGLPFLAGLSGTFALYRAFQRMVVTGARPESPRTATPGRLVLAWSVLFTGMAPLGVWRILDTLIH